MTASFSPVVKYHGLARRYLLGLGFLMRPQLNSGTLGGVDFLESLNITVVYGIAFLLAPAFASFRAIRSTQRTELRGYAFALLAVLGVGVCALIVDVVHFFDHPLSYRPSATRLVMDSALAVPALAALILVVTRWRRLPNRPSRRVRSA